MEAAHGQSQKNETRIIRIKLIDGTKINGRVNINIDRNEGFDRLSDLVSSNDETQE